MYTVPLKKFVEQMHIENCAPEVNIDDIKITQADTNRPALQLAGFFDYFDHHRVQIIGQVEYTYIEKQGVEKSCEMMEKIMDYKVPCIIFCRDLPVFDEFVELSRKHGIPIFKSKSDTSDFQAEATRWLKVELAPRISIHGVLVDIYGEGVFITGESGIGKSEVAIELIHRGHRLVSDDVVEIKKVSDATLIGSAPDITRHFIELRGIGIIDAKTLFGVESVKNTQAIDLVIQLEEWNKDQEYDRMGLEEYYIGVDIGGTSIKMGLFSHIGELLEKWNIPTDVSNSGANILNDIVNSIEEKREKLKANIKGIGLGVPGPMTEDGTVLKCSNLGWGVFNVKNAVADLTGVGNVKVGNDANLAGLGELWKGGGRGYDSIVMITLGTGCGGAVILNGKVLTGYKGTAGEIGHIKVERDETETCGCGKKGCLEQYVSGPGIVRMQILLLQQLIKL